MANFHPSLNTKAVPFEAGSTIVAPERKLKSVEQLIVDLYDPDLREKALNELSKKREMFLDLAPIMWNSYGIMAILLQEIVAVYPVLSPPNLSSTQSNRVCNALALLQCVASHPDTRKSFLNAHIPLYLYHFLNTTCKNRSFEYLRLTSLGVIGALVKVCGSDFGSQSDDMEVINFLLSTEIIPLCLRTMELGSELSKTVEFFRSNFYNHVTYVSKVATFIVQKILLDDIGLEYMCASAERFFALSRVLTIMVNSLADHPSTSTRLLKHIVRCYLRLSDNPRACDALRNNVPEKLKDTTFNVCFHGDPTIRRWLQQLFVNINQGGRIAQAGGGFDYMMVN